MRAGVPIADEQVVNALTKSSLEAHVGAKAIALSTTRALRPTLQKEPTRD